jgi:hypothetical protein
LLVVVLRKLRVCLEEDHILPGKEDHKRTQTGKLSHLKRHWNQEDKTDGNNCTLSFTVS